MKPQRTLTIRKGPVFWEWKRREEPKSKYRTTKILSAIPSADACQIIAHDWLALNPKELLTVAVELTDEQIAAGSQGISEDLLP